MDLFKLAQQNVTTIDNLTGTRRQPRKTLVVEERRTREGRARERARGHINRDTLDSSGKDFIAWDGEGLTYGKEPIETWVNDVCTSRHYGQQSYVLFGASTGEKEVEMRNRLGLTTKRCLDLMLKVEKRHPNAIHVGFSIGYDAEMIFRNLTVKELRRLHGPNHVVRWGKYRIEYIPRKWLQVSTGSAKERTLIVCRIYDVWSFFMKSFVATLREYLPDIPAEELNAIEKMKGLRQSFTKEELYSDVIPYWKQELKYTVELMTKFRGLLAEANLFPTHWHGPATISQYMFKKHGVKKHMSRDIPTAVTDAAQCGFSGGRIEQLMVGRACCKVYKSDIRSAYPYGMQHLPSLAGQKWTYRRYGTNLKQPTVSQLSNMYGLFYIRFECSPRTQPRMPQPFFHRNEVGGISYPRVTEGWYWTPEVSNALKAGFDLESDNLMILESWTIDGWGSLEKPFDYIPSEFAKRMSWKNAIPRIAAEVGIKLGLNSGWGKLAQRVGGKAATADKEAVIPTWHQYEWAGFVTSVTRARIYQAMVFANHNALGRGVIAVETDAVLSTVPIPQLGKDNGQLGDWETEEYEDCVYLQNGVYWLMTKDKILTDKMQEQGYQQDRYGDIWKMPKLRGMDKGSLHIDQVLDYLETTPTDEVDVHDTMKGMQQTRFVLSKGAIARKRLDVWRCWETVPKELGIWVTPKRIHNAERCTACKAGVLRASDGLHDLITRPPRRGQSERSFSIKLPWRTVEGQVPPAEQEDEEHFDIEPSLTMENSDL